MNPDYALFQFLNGSLHLAFLDPLMVFITDSDRVMHGTIIAMIVYLFFQKGTKEAWIFLLGAVVAFAIADGVAYRILKPYFGRVRPANPAYFIDNMNQFIVHTRILIGQNGGFSTPSNHAANMFAQATYWSLIYPRWAKILFPIGFLIAYTRIYVGVHYPFDIFLGACLGSSVAILVYLMLRKTPVCFPENSTTQTSIKGDPA